MTTVDDIDEFLMACETYRSTVSESAHLHSKARKVLYWVDTAAACINDIMEGREL